jgi:hypothetical protein
MGVTSAPHTATRKCVVHAGVLHVGRFDRPVVHAGVSRVVQGPSRRVVPGRK